MPTIYEARKQTPTLYTPLGNGAPIPRPVSFGTKMTAKYTTAYGPRPSRLTGLALGIGTPTHKKYVQPLKYALFANTIGGSGKGTANPRR